MSPPNLCACGCETVVKTPGRRFALGHHMRTPAYRRSGVASVHLAAAAKSLKAKIRRRWRLSNAFGELSSREQAIAAFIEHRAYTRGFLAGQRKVSHAA